jgi:hypothetical protein
MGLLAIIHLKIAHLISIRKLVWTDWTYFKYKICLFVGEIFLKVGHTFVVYFD